MNEGTSDRKASVVEHDGVITFGEGDFSGGSKRSHDGFAMRLRLPRQYGTETNAIKFHNPSDKDYLVQIKGNYVHLEDWEAWDDDRFLIFINYRPQYWKQRQRLTVYGDGEVVSEHIFRGGDVLWRPVEAESIAFEVDESFVPTETNRNKRQQDTGSEQ